MRNDDTEGGIDHMARMLALAKSLRERGAAIYHHRWDVLAMGSWSIVAGTRHQCYLFTWDGKDGDLSIRGPFTAVQAGCEGSQLITIERIGRATEMSVFERVASFFEGGRQQP